MTTAAVFGFTGAVGSHILSTLLSSDAFVSVKTISRRLPKAQSPKLEAIQEADTSKWGGIISSLSPKPSAVFNAIGTTRAAAGGIQNQWKIDHDLCNENATAGKEADVRTYLFISSAATRDLLSISVPYSTMKVGVEDAIKELDFEQAIPEAGYDPRGEGDAQGAVLGDAHREPTPDQPVVPGLDRYVPPPDRQFRTWN